MTALKAMTLWPAWQHFEEKTKGSIEVGKLADLVILDQDPTAIDPENIDLIKIVQTIKEGVVVFDLATAPVASVPSQEGHAAFTRVLAAVGGHRAKAGHVHGTGCLCGAMSRISALVAGDRAP
jgi:urease alpha subunit